MGNESATIEVDCPVCEEIVYVPRDSHGERVDCLDCGAALRTRCVDANDAHVTLEVVVDTVVVADPDAPPPPLGAGRHLAAFDTSETPDLFPEGGWQRDAFAAINTGMARKP